MKVTFIGHAAILIETNGIRILSDPWWRGPCFGAQWWIYPQADLNSVHESPVDYIYISHGHNDHWHPGTLKTFSRDTRILVSRDINLAPYIRDLGFEVIELSSNQEYSLTPDVKCRIWETCNSDTIMTVSDGSQVCVNLNDALHATSDEIQDQNIRRLKQTYPRLDYVFCGYGVASHFPNCYRIPGKDRVATAIQRQRYFSRRWARIMRGLEPVYGFPFAANVVFLEDDLFWSNEPTHNAERPTDVFSALQQDLSTKVIDIAPGFSISNHEIVNNNLHKPLFSQTLLEDYADLIERANRYGSVEQGAIEKVRCQLETNISRCRDYLRSYPGTYRLLIRFRNSDCGLCIIKDDNDIRVATKLSLSSDPVTYDLTYTTRLPYLDASLATEFGHEILFVGSGGIFEYHDVALLPGKLHRELVVMMKRQDAAPPPKRHQNTPYGRFKQIVKKALGINEDDLYDLERWTVFESE